MYTNIQPQFLVLLDDGSIGLLTKVVRDRIERGPVRIKF